MVDFVSEDQVCRELKVRRDTLRQWIELGLVRATVQNEKFCFEPDQIRRIWSIASLRGDLEVNLAGIQIILELSDQIQDLKAALMLAARRLESVQRVDRFRLRILEESSGPFEWEIDLRH